MTTDLERRIGEGLRGVADGLTVVPPTVDELRARANRGAPASRRLRGGWWPGRSLSGRWAGPVLAALAVSTVLGLATVAPGTGLRLPGPGGANPGVATGDAPALPSRFAGMSLLTAPVSTSPPGPAVALYRQGSLGTRLGTSQTLVLGVDGRTYRRLDLAEERGVTGPDGEWHAAESLLGPDGGQVAVADPARLTDHLDLVDLRTGQVREFPLVPPAAAFPLSWTPDGTRLVVELRDRPWAEESATDGRLVVLDVGTGQMTPLPRVAKADMFDTVVVSPDGALLAVPVQAGRIDILDLAGVRLRTLTVPEGYHLDSNAAWSPDGRWLMVRRLDVAQDALALVDATGATTGIPVPLPGFQTGGAHRTTLLGWTGPDAVLLGVEGRKDYEIVRRSLDGTTRVLSRAGQGIGQVARVDDLRLAGGLVTDLRTGDPGDPDRGPWPRWWRVLVAAGAGLVAWSLFRWVRRRRTTVPGTVRPDTGG
ncbi:hypothetical protein [Plantactinospora sp. B24E8]|uniref:WD40 repeat domain-containing protein n=1 Tax=Plantactinospora sp. B24E8 TaxID=3153567 RepID=UPI00325DE62C